MASKKHTMTAEIVARGRVGDGVGPIHVHISNNGIMHADCEVMPRFWFKSSLPSRVPGTARIEGLFKGKKLGGTMTVDEEGNAYANDPDHPEFYLAFLVPEAFMPPCSGNPNVAE